MIARDLSKSTITLSELAGCCAAIISLTFFITTYFSDTAHNKFDNTALRADMVVQVSALNTTLTGGLAEIRQQISALPIQGERLRQLEQAQSEFIKDRAININRINIMEKAVSENTMRLEAVRSQIDSIARASAPIQGTRR